MFSAASTTSPRNQCHGHSTTRLAAPHAISAARSTCCTALDRGPVLVDVDSVRLWARAGELLISRRGRVGAFVRGARGAADSAGDWGLRWLGVGRRRGTTVGRRAGAAARGAGLLCSRRALVAVAALSNVTGHSGRSDGLGRHDRGGGLSGHHGPIRGGRSPAGGGGGRRISGRGLLWGWGVLRGAPG